MSSSPLRWLRTIHAWTGVLLSLLLILISLTGTLLVWKNDYVRLVTPAAQVNFEPTPERLAALAAAVETRYADDEVLLIEFPTAAFPLTKVRLADTRYAYLDVEGNPVDEWTQNERWEEWLYDLHHRLLLGDTGLFLTGFGALLAIFLVLSGLIVFWPLRRGWRLGFWPQDTTRPRLLISHRNLGILVALPLLLTLVTAAILAFPEQSASLLLEPFRGEDYSMDFSENLDDLDGKANGEWLPVMQRALATFPDSRIRTAQVPGFFSIYRIAGLQRPGDLNPTGTSKVYIDADGGWMDIRIDMQAQHVSERLYNLAYPLHTGRFDNLAYKLLLTLNGLLIAALACFGGLAFLRRWIR